MAFFLLPVPRPPERHRGESLPNQTPTRKIFRRDQNEISLLDYLDVLLKRRKIVIAISAVALVLSVIVCLLLPKEYLAKASVVPPTQEMPLGIGGIASGGGAGELVGAFLGVGSPADLWVGILSSNTVRDALINRFDLMTVYRKKTIEDARKALDRRTTTKRSREGVVSVSVEDRQPQRAADMANAYIEELDKINKNMVTTSGGRMRLFIERRLNEAKIELTKAEEALREFQEKNKAVSLDAQSKAVIETIGTLKGELLAKEIQIETMLSYSTPQHPQVEVLRSEIEQFKQKLRDLERGTASTDDAQGPTAENFDGIFIPTEKIPALALQYARLLREAKIQETLYELLSQQYELARIQEARDTPTVQILDWASVPTKKIKPRRRLIVGGSTIIALFLSSFLALFLEYVQSQRESRRV